MRLVVEKNRWVLDLEGINGFLIWYKLKVRKLELIRK